MAPPADGLLAAMTLSLLFVIPTFLIFFAAFAAARPAPGRVTTASWILAIVSALTGIAMPLVQIGVWIMGMSMSAGTHTGMSALDVLRIFVTTPYHLWFALTVAPVAVGRSARKFDLPMHFIYLPASLLFTAYVFGPGGQFLLFSATGAASLIAFWYRLVDLQVQLRTG